MTYLLQHGNYGEGAINPYMVSDSSLKLLAKVREIAGDAIGNIHAPFDSGNSISVQLTKDKEYNGFTYNMFFIDVIQELTT